MDGAPPAPSSRTTRGRPARTVTVRRADEALATPSSVNRVHLQPSPIQMNGSVTRAHCTPPPVPPRQPPAPWLEIAARPLPHATSTRQTLTYPAMLKRPLAA